MYSTTLFQTSPISSAQQLPKTSSTFLDRAALCRRAVSISGYLGAKKCDINLLKTQLCVIFKKNKTKQNKQPAFTRLSPLTIIRTQYFRYLPWLALNNLLGFCSNAALLEWPLQEVLLPLPPRACVLLPQRALFNAPASRINEPHNLKPLCLASSTLHVCKAHPTMAGVRISIPVWAEECSGVWTAHISCIQAPADGHLGCFHIW